MKKIFIFILLYMSLMTVSFSQGISFEEGSWDEVVTKARSQNRLIFLDVYAAWCGPCKRMDKYIFPDAKAGAFYNQHFISYKLDAENGEGPSIAAKYGIRAYPYNLYIDPHRLTVVYKSIGYVNIDAFIRNGEAALNSPRPVKQPAKG